MSERLDQKTSENQSLMVAIEKLKGEINLCNLEKTHLLVKIEEFKDTNATLKSESITFKSLI